MLLLDIIYGRKINIDNYRGQKVVKRKFTGYRKFNLKDFQPTHYILTREEYDEWDNEQKCQVRDYELSLKELENKIKNQKSSFEKKLSEQENEFKKILEKKDIQHRDEIQNLKNKIKKEIDKNKDLIRVAKERANSKRNLYPKKQRYGYVFLNSEEYTYIFSKEIRLPCWKIRIQMPYSIKLNEDTIKALFLDDLKNNLGSLIKIEKLYYNNLINNLNNKEKIIELWHEDNVKNFIFRYVFKANGLKGLWEIELLSKNMININDDLILNK